MPVINYLCKRCHELFYLLEPHPVERVRCPWCSSVDVKESVDSSPGIGPPPWEYGCRQCGGRFRVSAPRGPSEEKKIRCPICASSNIEWCATVSQACPPGG